MNKFFFDNKINLLFLLISLLCLVSMQGMENISPLSIKWAHTIEKFNRDPALYQTAWYFFLKSLLKALSYK